MKSISTRIILLVLICSIPMAAIVGATSIYRSMKVIETEARENLIQKTEIHSENINNKLSIYETTNHGIHQLIQSIIDVNHLGDEGYLENYIDNILDPTIKKTISRTDYCMGMSVVFDYKFTGKTEGAWWVVDKEGDIERFLPRDLSDKAENDISSKWYYDAFNSKTGNWSDPYVNDREAHVITYSEPIIVNSIPIGVVTIDLMAEKIAEEINSIKIFDTGYGYLLSKNFDYLFHPNLNNSSNFKTINEGEYNAIGEKIEKEELGIVETHFSGETKLMSFAKLVDGKILILTVPRKEILATMYNTIYIILIVIVIAMGISVFLALFAGRRISKPIIMVTDILNTTEKLDLRDIEETEEIKAILNRKDEIGSILRATASLRASLRDIVKTIDNTVVNVLENINYLYEATDETSQSINDVTITVEELAKASMGQAEDAELGATKLMSLAEEIAAAVENGEIATNNSMSAGQMTQEGSKALNTMTEKINITNQSTSIVSENINSLLEKSQSIGNILNSINDISEQTNLLALNAAIEAARAG